jgi:hypothetical protein
MKPAFPKRLHVLIEHDRTGAPVGRTIVVHPFWGLDCEAGRRLLGADAGGTRTRFVDTSNFERRPLGALDLAPSREDAYPRAAHPRAEAV